MEKIKQFHIQNLLFQMFSSRLKKGSEVSEIYIFKNTFVYLIKYPFSHTLY